MFYLRPAVRITDGPVTALPVIAQPVLLDANGEATVSLLTTREGTAAGWEVFEAPGQLPGPSVFQVPEGEGTLEYSEALPIAPGGFLYNLDGGADFPDDAPLGSQGADWTSGVAENQVYVYEKVV
jgi:hypothetical protein